MTPRVLLVESAGTSDDGLVPGFPRALDKPLAPPPDERRNMAEPDHESAWTAHAPATREFLLRLRAAAEQETPVYLYGEPGSGRTRAARILCHWRAEWKANGHPHRVIGDEQVPILRVPSLRERPEDLPELAEHHLAKRARETGEPSKWLTPQALDALVAREWRGNLAELHAVLDASVQRAGARRLIDADDLPQGAKPAQRPSQMAKDAAQRYCLLRQLRSARSVSGAAKLEGATRANYIRLMRRLGILRADCVGSGQPG